MANTKRVGKYFIIGLLLTVANYLMYTFLALVIFNDNDFLWCATLISTSITTVMAYFCHSKITWKEREITKSAKYKLFVWNILISVVINPLFTQFFSLADWLYQWVHGICELIHLPFEYEFIQSTGAFGLTACVTMVLNYLFYDKFVFGKSGQRHDNTTVAKSVADFDENPKISVIIPAYNAAASIEACLDSIMAQTYHNLEIIVVDDGSTDDTLKILRKYAKKDARIVVVTQENQGQSVARNMGLEKAEGDFVSFIDADDTVCSDFIAKLLYAIRPRHALSVCGVKYNRLYNHTSKDVYVESLPASLTSLSAVSVLHSLAIDGRLYPAWNKLYRAELAKKIKFDEKLNFAEDTKFVLDYLQLARSKKYAGIALVLEPLYIYNFGTEFSTIKTTATSWKNWQTSYQNLKRWLGPHASLTEKFWLRAVHLRWRVSYVRSRQRSRKIDAAK